MSPKNFGQAIDLSALGKPAPAAVQGAGYEVNSENLVKEILPVSQKRVVFLVCWSPRSQESIELLQAFNALALQDLGPNGEPAWILASVNVDTQQQVAAALQLQSVPTAVAIIQEQIAPLFESNLPAEQIRLIIDKVLALAAERGVGDASAAAEPIEAPVEPEEVEAMEAMERGDFEGAKAAFTRWSNRKPAEPLAKLGIAQSELLIRIKDVDSNQAIPEADGNPTSIEFAIRAADIEVSQGNYEAAFERLITLIKILPADEKKVPREHLLALFTLVDASDPAIIAARKKLASALY
jgi:putative thioredoxin